MSYRTRLLDWTVRYSFLQGINWKKSDFVL